MFEGLSSDNLAIIICCIRSPVQALEPFSITLERKSKGMNAKWKEHACKLKRRRKEDESTWMHIGMNRKGIYERKMKEINTNERNMKGEWKEHDGKWMQNERNMHANERNIEEHACKWTQNEKNMNCCRSTWTQQNNSSMHFWACLGLAFGFMLDLEYADIHKTLESHRVPRKAITIATSHM